MKDNPLVSVIMPAYNAEKTIKEAINSVIRQTYIYWELIIVNDCSTDTTIDIIGDYASKDSRVRIFNNKTNLKVAKTRNVALENAKGDYLAFLDSDDAWCEDKLEEHIRLMVEKGIDFTYSNVFVKRENRKNKKEIIFDSKINYKELLKSNQISCLTAVLRKDIIKDLKMQDIGHEDYVFWLTILKDRVRYAYNVNKTLAIYREASASLSGNKIKAAKWQWNIYRNIENIPLLTSIYYFINYGIKGIWKRI